MMPLPPVVRSVNHTSYRIARATADQAYVGGLVVNVPLGPAGVGVPSAAMEKSVGTLHDPALPLVLSARTHQRKLWPGVSPAVSAKEVVVEVPTIPPTPVLRSVTQIS